MIDRVNQVVDEYLERGFRLTLRQLYYIASGYKDVTAFVAARRIRGEGP